MTSIFSSDSESDSEEKEDEKRSTFHQHVRQLSPITKAVQQKDIPKIKECIQNGRDTKSTEFERALWDAAAAGFAAGVQLLFAAGVNPNVWVHDMSPLMVACMNGRTACVQELLGNGGRPADINLARHGLCREFSPFAYQKTALYYAVLNNQMDCVKLLIKKDAKVTMLTLSAAINSGVDYCQELFTSPTTTFDSNLCYKAILGTTLNDEVVEVEVDEDVMHFLVENVKFTTDDKKRLFRPFAGVKYKRWKYVLEKQWKPDGLVELFGELTRFKIQQNWVDVLQDILRLVLENDPESEVEVNAASFCLLFDRAFVRTKYDIHLLQKFIQKYELDKSEDFTFGPTILNSILNCGWDDMRLENVKFLMNYNINPIHDSELIVHVSNTQELKRALYVSRAFSTLFFIIIKVDELEWCGEILQELTNVTIIGDNTTFTSKVRIKCTTLRIKGCTFPHGLECDCNRLFMEECEVNDFSCVVLEHMSVSNSQIVENGLRIDSSEPTFFVPVELVNTSFERCALGIVCLSDQINIYTTGVIFKENTFDIDTENGSFFIVNPTGLKVDTKKLQSYKPNDGELVVIGDTTGHSMNHNGWYKINQRQGQGQGQGQAQGQPGVRSNKVFRLINVHSNFTYTFSRLVLEGFELGLEILLEPPTRMYPFLSELVFKINLLETDWDFTKVVETTEIFSDLLSCFNNCVNILSPIEFEIPIDAKASLTFRRTPPHIPAGYCIMDTLVSVDTNYYDDLIKRFFDLGAVVSKYTIVYAIANGDMTPNVLEMCIEHGSTVSIDGISNALHLEVDKKNIKVLVDSTSAGTSEIIMALINYNRYYPEIYGNFLEQIKEQTWEDTGVIGYAIVQRDNIEEDFQYEEYIPDLLEAGAKINALFKDQNEKPRTPLYLCATEWGNIEAFEHILEIADASGQIEDVLRSVGNHHIHGETTPEKLVCAGLLMDIVEDMPFERYLNNPLPVDSEDFFGWLTTNQNVIDILFRRCRYGGINVKKPYLNPNLVPLSNAVRTSQLENGGASPWWSKRYSREEMDQKKEWCQKVQQSKPLAMEVLHWHGAALQYLPYNMQNDPNLCLEAVKQDGMALHWCSVNRKMDLEVVTEAVTQNWRSFEFLPEHLEHDGHVLPLPSQDYGPWIIWMKDNLFVEGAVHVGQWTQFMTKFPASAGLAMYRKYDSQDRKKASVNEALKSFKRKRVDDLYKHRIIQL